MGILADNYLSLLQIYEGNNRCGIHRNDALMAAREKYTCTT